MMRKIAFLAAFAAVAGAGVAHAQATTPDQPRQMGRGPGGRGGPGMMEHALLQNITLSDAQKAKLEDLHKAERAKMEANGQNGRGDFDAIREARQKGDSATAQKLMAEQRSKMEARRDEQVASIRGILTADQQKQFETNVAEMKKHDGERGPGRGRPGL
jgi:Spy/CpxP family protein refolding chaperone